MKKILIFGMGYVGKHLADALKGEYQVVGTVREVAEVNQIKWNASESDVERKAKSHAEIEALILEVDAILCSIPPNDEGDLAFAQFGDLIAKSNVKWVGYLSTTGVYGDHVGGDVDETTPNNPQNARAKRRVLAENQWMSLTSNNTNTQNKSERSVNIFRLPGIYGVGRSAFDALSAGRAKRIDMRLKYGAKKGRPHFFCRAHVDDIVQVIVASLEKKLAGAHIYNIVDDLPASQADIVSFAANMMAVDVPPMLSEQQAKMSDMAKSFYSECKYMLNDKIKAELGVTLKHPTYKDGLKAIWHEIN